MPENFATERTIMHEANGHFPSESSGNGNKADRQQPTSGSEKSESIRDCKTTTAHPHTGGGADLAQPIVRRVGSADDNNDTKSVRNDKFLIQSNASGRMDASGLTTANGNGGQPDLDPEANKDAERDRNAGSNNANSKKVGGSIDRPGEPNTSPSVRGAGCNGNADSKKVGGSIDPRGEPKNLPNARGTDSAEC